jgi:hypothetical protein
VKVVDVVVDVGMGADVDAVAMVAMEAATGTLQVSHPLALGQERLVVHF